MAFTFSKTYFQGDYVQSEGSFVELYASCSLTGATIAGGNVINNLGNLFETVYGCQVLSGCGNWIYWNMVPNAPAAPKTCRWIILSQSTDTSGAWADTGASANAMWQMNVRIVGKLSSSYTGSTSSGA